MSDTFPPRMTTAEAATYLGLAAATLEKDRVVGGLDIPFLRLGRAVRYDRTDLDRWLNARRQEVNHAA